MPSNHASDEVAISVEQAGDGCKVIFQDDGEGFTERIWIGFSTGFIRAAAGALVLAWLSPAPSWGTTVGGLQPTIRIWAPEVVVLLPRRQK